MAQYIIQAIAFQLFFLIVYDVFLKKETFFNWNRAYLLITAILSFVLPFIKIEMFKNIVPQQYIITLPEVVIGKQNPIVLDEVFIEGANQASSFSWSWMYLFYFGSAIAFSIFAYKLINIIRLIYSNPKQEEQNLQIVNLENSRDAFSFFNYIFIGKQLESEERETIIKHELVHVKQKHTFDMLFFEILRVFFWFNPLIYMYQNRISVVHEFIADAEAVKHNKTQYYQNLLSQVFHAKQVSFINPFFKESLIKKRIVMLQKSKSKQVQLLRYALLIPMVIGMLIYSSCSDENQKREDLMEENSIKELSILEQIEAIKKEIEIQGEVTQEGEKGLFLLLGRTTFNINQDFLDKVDEYNEAENKNEIHKKITYLFKSLPTEGSITDEEIFAIKKLITITQGSSLNSSEYEGKSEVPFSVISQVPVFPGCNSQADEAGKKVCFNEGISNFVAKNFNADLAKTLDLKGSIKISVFFKIDNQGNIIEAKARAPKPELEVEAVRVVNMLPKMTPGMHGGKAVNVPYYLPIKFEIKE
ncbi:M56 family metallopeptidase [Xanthomarina spongicola]|uniref:Beta-lactamase regulating signal transducer with metallopeptidase domain n=1 Tax=Xanthomarina spongicola TaxID=570520 RepID=A0A316DQI8_9FLAO|nr:M56 family metallopeptidase [Xanthomarina spongicola]PWK19003.1 beta-lactamase regulating signal transducer with metallopeptidase domain [Xanthomarina spongicola]